MENRRDNVQTRVENRQDNRRAEAFRENRGDDFRNQNRNAFRNNNNNNNNNNNRAEALRNNNNRAEAFRNNREDAIRAQNRANLQANRAYNNRWDSRSGDRRRFQAQRFNNWNDQRTYLRSNLSRFNQLSRLNQLQQQQLDNQMRAAFLRYHNNRWAGSYGWNEYSDPMFLDYLQTNNSSLLGTILAAIGIGGGGNGYMINDGAGYGRYDGYDGYVGGDYGEELY
jgi:hypothetical protein